MPGQQIASTGNDLPALAKVPVWTARPDVAPGLIRPERDMRDMRDIAARASAGLDATAGKKRPSSPGDGPGETGTDWPLRFARMLTEALAGARPAGQITPWTSKRARSQFLRLSRAFGSGDHALPGSARGGRQPRIVRVVATRPARDAIEMSVIARFGDRVRALALRLERTAPEDSPAQWICTDIEAA
jgi:hypothetical protein